MKITVIGCGRWGSFIGWYLDQIGHEVSFYGPADTPHMQRYLETRTNGMLTMRESIGFITDIQEALQAVDVNMLDHIIVADDDFVSMADNGFFKKY